MFTHKGRFSQFDEDAYRLPEGTRRIAYDAETLRYTFRDRSGQLYQGSPGETYGVLKPVAAPLSHRRNVTVAERYDPALRRWDARPAKAFNDILPPTYIASAQAAQVGAEWAALPSDALLWSDLVQAAIPKVQEVVEVVRRRTTLKRRKSKARETAPHGEPESRQEIESVPSIPSAVSARWAPDERRKLLEEEWEVVRTEDVPQRREEVPQPRPQYMKPRRTKSEIWPPKFFKHVSGFAKNVGMR